MSDYEIQKTAEILKTFGDNVLNNRNDFADLVYAFADLFAENNPNFAESQFIQACGQEKGKE